MSNQTVIRRNSSRNKGGVGWPIKGRAASTMSFVIYHQAVAQGLNTVDTGRGRLGKQRVMGPRDRWINTTST